MGLYFFLNQISLVGKVLKEIKLEIFHKKCQVFQRAVKLLGWPGRTLSRDIPETNFELLKQVITKRIELLRQIESSFSHANKSFSISWMSIFP